MRCRFPGLRPPEIPNQFNSFVHHSSQLRLRNRSALFGEVFEIGHIGTCLFFKNSRHEPTHEFHWKIGKLEFVFANPPAPFPSKFRKIIFLNVVDTFGIIGYAVGFRQCFRNCGLDHNQMAFPHLVFEFPLGSFFSGFTCQGFKRHKSALPVFKIIGILQ